VAWTLSDPRATERAKLKDSTGADLPDSPVFEVGFWPPSICAQIDARLDRMAEVGRGLRNQFEKDGAARGLSGEALTEFVLSELRKGPSTDLAEEDHATWVLMVRWGLRGWEGINGVDGPVPCLTRTVTIDGIEHVEVLPESIWLLKANRLLSAVGTRIALFNRLSGEEKKRSG